MILVDSSVMPLLVVKPPVNAHFPAALSAFYAAGKNFPLAALETMIHSGELKGDKVNPSGASSVAAWFQQVGGRN